MGTALQISDRGYRYRANQAIPEHPKVCAFCGETRSLMVAHLDGHEENTEASNLTWSCRSCNTHASNTLRNAGKGRLTRQYNPTKTGGAKTLGEWVQAVGAITPRKGAKYAGRRYGLVSDMPVSEAVAIIRATPHAKRSEFASKLRRRNPGEELIDKAKTATSPDDIAQLWNYADDNDDSVLKTAVRDRVKELGLEPSDFNINPAKKKRRNAMSRSDKKALSDLTNYGKTIATYSIPGLWEASTLAQAFRNPAKKKNPAGDASAAYEEFHGQAPSETVTVEKRVHYHKHLAAAGELRRLVVLRRVDSGVTVLSRFKGALLAFNEQKNQLFIEGGDQLIDLRAFGINPKEAHELETLGRVKSIDYHAVKTHLGDEGGEATYEHGFRMTNENGRHVVVKIARYPDLVYSVPSEQLLFSGGSYLIRAEGIDK